MNKRVTKILIIISIIIIGLGILGGFDIYQEFIGDSDPTYANVDGTDFGPLVDMFKGAGTIIILFMIGGYTIAVVASIWIIYLLIILVLNIIKKVKSKNNKQ